MTAYVRLIEDCLLSAHYICRQFNRFEEQICDIRKVNLLMLGAQNHFMRFLTTRYPLYRSEILLSIFHITDREGYSP